MPPARKRRRVRNIKKNRKFGLLKVIIFVVLVVALFFILSSQSRFWDSSSKLTLASVTAGGDVIISSFDPQAGSITNITIPGSTQLIVARQLGTWQAKSLWQLGTNEKIGGELLRQTMVKNFYFPVVAWSDRAGSGFSRGEPIGIIRAALLPYKSNLKIGDRIKLGLFAFSVQNSQRIDIDMSEGNFLKKTRLTDGTEGYIPTGTGMQRLTVFFADNIISGGNLRVEIKDATGGGTSIAEEVGKAIEVMGAKVSSVSKQPEEDSDCEVSGKDKRLIKLIADVFDCEIVKENALGNFDAVVKLGKSFEGRN